MTVVALSTGLRRGELLGLRWQDVQLLERRLSVVQQVVRNEVTTPKSRAGRRAVGLGPVAVDALEEQYQGVQAPGTGVDRVLAPGARHAARSLEALDLRAKGAPGGGVPDAFRPWHGLRHTALTETAAAGVPGMFVQAKAGHAHGSTTERYLHAHKTSYPDAAELAEARLFARVSGCRPKRQSAQRRRTTCASRFRHESSSRSSRLRLEGGR